MPTRLSGGNISLGPEVGDTISLGFDWAPGFMDGVSISATYTRARLDNQITTVASDLFPAAETLLDSNIYRRADLPGFFTSGFDFATFESFPIDPAVGVITVINSIPVHTAGFKSESIDFNIDYRFSTVWADFEANLYGTYSAALEFRPVVTANPEDTVGLINGVDRWADTFSFGFSRRRYSATLLINYTHSYINTRENSFFTTPGATNARGPQKVDNYVTVDLTGSYDLAESGWRILMGARNLTDASFPFVDNLGRPFDSSRVDVRGRILYMEVKKTFDF